MDEIIKKLITSDLKLIEKETGIPYDRMYKWRKGKSKPKSEDLLTLISYFDGILSNRIEENQQSNNTYDELISLLKDRIREKDERIQEKNREIERILTDKDKIIARTEESLELWKEKAQGYEKKISADIPGVGTTKQPHPKLGQGRQ